MTEVRAVYRFIQAHQATGQFSVSAMCRVFEVLRESYYGWCRRQLLKAHHRSGHHTDQQVLQKIRSIHAESRHTYGVNRMTVSLKRWDSGISRRRTYRLMHEHGIRGVTRRRRWNSTRRDHRWHGIEDLVERNFEASKPRQLVASDSSQIRIRGGTAHLAVTLDLCSRKVVGWAVSRSQETELMLSALKKTVRRGSCAGMIHHSDQGSQYTSTAFRKLCRAHGIRQSTGSVGDCYDNAMVESFFATLKSEWVQDRCFETIDELRGELRSYIDDFYNARRLHSSLGYVSPNEYEAEFRKTDLSGASPRQVRSHGLAQTHV